MLTGSPNPVAAMARVVRQYEAIVSQHVPGAPYSLRQLERRILRFGMIEFEAEQLELSAPGSGNDLGQRIGVVRSIVGARPHALRLAVVKIKTEMLRHGVQIPIERRGAIDPVDDGQPGWLREQLIMHQLSTGPNRVAIGNRPYQIVEAPIGNAEVVVVRVAIFLDVPARMMEIADEERKDVARIGEYDMAVESGKRNCVRLEEWRRDVPQRLPILIDKRRVIEVPHRGHDCLIAALRLRDECAAGIRNMDETGLGAPLR